MREETNLLWHFIFASTQRNAC